MMSVVVDASFLVAATSDEGDDGRWAEKVIAEHVLLAPHLAMVEATNILRRLELAKQLSPIEAELAQLDLMRLDVRLFPFAPFSERVWELRDNLTSYDAWYVALAESLALPFATLDRRLARASGPSCVFLVPGR